MGNLEEICSGLHCRRNKAKASSRTHGSIAGAVRLFYFVHGLPGAHKLVWDDIPEKTSVTIHFPADCGLVPIQQLGYLNLIVPGFHECVNLISFSLAEEFVFRKQQQLARSRSLESYTSSATQPSVNQSCTSCLNPPYLKSFLKTN